MNKLYLPMAMAAILGASGCVMEDMEGSDPLEQQTEATGESASPITIGNVRIRNSSTALCVQVNTALTVLASAPCSNISSYVRWYITEVAPGLHILRPKPDLTRCMQALATTPSAPTIGPCQLTLPDQDAAGQLFHVAPVGGGKYEIYRTSLFDPPLYLTALQPNDVFLDNAFGVFNNALQRWTFF